MAAFRCRAEVASLTKRVLLLNNRVTNPVLSVRNINSEHWEPEDKETHTGQKWTEKDYRLVRFIETPKQVNEKFAIDLIDNTPPTPIHDRHVWCNGGGGPLGHPRVYINLDPPGNHACGYCGLRFYQEKHH